MKEPILAIDQVVKPFDEVAELLELLEISHLSDKVRKLVRLIQRERHPAILYTSHNMRDIEEVCDRVMFLHDGNILAEATAEQITERFFVAHGLPKSPAQSA